MATEVTTVEDLVKLGSVRLRRAGIDTARLDARVLLGHLLHREPSTILPGDSSPVGESVQEKFLKLIARREVHEPVSRIVGQREFFARPFRIDPAVLDPRADSECVVELALELVPSPGRVLDLGTGSGCLLLSILSERPGARGVGVDCSGQALEIARSNADSLGCSDRVDLVESDWFQRIAGRFDLIISNPPYIRASDIPALMPDVRLHDPMIALDGGSDGMDAYRAILRAAADHLNNGASVVLEIGEGQMDSVAGIANGFGFEMSATTNDLGGHVRGLAFTVPS
jgi:release factor glutamine methyltransferase